MNQERKKWKHTDVGIQMCEPDCWAVGRVAPGVLLPRRRGLSLCARYKRKGRCGCRCLGVGHMVSVAASWFVRFWPHHLTSAEGLP